MNYKLQHTKLYDKDLINCFYYIKQELKADNACVQFKKAVYKAYKNLKTIPESFGRIKLNNKEKCIIRFYSIGNYVILYSIHDNIVRLHRFLYAKRNWKTLLEKNNFKIEDLKDIK